MSDAEMPVFEAKQKYIAAALRFGESRRTRQFEAGNSSADELNAIGRVLREHSAGQEALRQLLAHDDLNARLWAAKDCLFFDRDTASEVLDTISNSPGFEGLSARTTLSEWRAGRLRRSGA